MLHLPADLDKLFGSAFGDTLVIAASPIARAHVSVSKHAAIETIDSSDDLAELGNVLSQLASSGKKASVIWISEREYEHFRPEIIPHAKIAAISFFSTGFSSGVLDSITEIVTSTDYRAQVERESAVLDVLDRSASLIFTSKDDGVRAEFDHWSSPYWFSLNGSLDFGHQCVLPTGEVSTLTDESSVFTTSSRFDLNGQLSLQGIPVVHRGSNETQLAEVAQGFDRLRSLFTSPCIATVEDGGITEVAPGSAGGDGCNALLSLFERDASYRKIHEIGLGTNEASGPLRDANFFPNERFPAIHFGLGLGGATALHIDLVCPQVGLVGIGNDGRTRTVI